MNQFQNRAAEIFTEDTLLSFYSQYHSQSFERLSAKHIQSIGQVNVRCGPPHLIKSPISCAREEA